MLLQPRGISPNPSVNVGEKFGENSGDYGKRGVKAPNIKNRKIIGEAEKDKAIPEFEIWSFDPL